MEGPHRRSLRRARAAHRRRGVRDVRRHRPAGDADAGGEPDRDALRSRRRKRRHPGRRRRHLVRHLQPRAGRADRAAARHRPADAARPVSAAGGGAGAAGRRPARSRSASSSTPAASSSPTALASSPIAAEQRRRFEAAMAEKERRYGERYPIDRRFPRRARRHAAGVRHRARLRPAGDAGDRRARRSSRCCGRRSPATTADHRVALTPLAARPMGAARTASVRHSTPDRRWRHAMLLRGLGRALVAGAVAAGFAQPVARTTYPSQNVTVIVAFPAGGLADMIGRLVSTKLDERLKQSFVVENRGGAGGNIAAKAVAGAAPDGYTLLATTSGLAVNMTASKNQGFETRRPAPGRLRRHQPRRDRHPSEQSGQGPEGVHRQRQGEELHLRQRRRRHRPADRRRVFLQGGRQGEIRARAVPGRRAGDHRDARQSRRLRWC